MDNSPQLHTTNVSNVPTSPALSAPSAIARRQAFAQAIRYFRHERGLSQEALAHAAEIDRSYMGRIERAERSISLDKIGALCDALHISELELFQQYTLNLHRDNLDN